MTFKVIMPLCLVALLCSVVAFLAGQARAVPVDPSPVDTWSVPRDKTENIIENNQTPGNYKVHNNAGTTSVIVTVYDSDDHVVDGPVTLEPTETSGQLGVPLGGRVAVENLGTKTARGTIWKFS